MIFSLFLSFVNFYSPPRPLLFEGGGTESMGMIDFDILYKDREVNSGITQSFRFYMLTSPDGTNSVGLYFPWVWYKRGEEKANFIGDIGFSYKRSIFKNYRFGYGAIGSFIEFPTGKDTLGYDDHKVWLQPFLSYSLEMDFVSFHSSLCDTLGYYSTSTKKWGFYNKIHMWVGTNFRLFDFLSVGTEVLLSRRISLFPFVSYRRANLNLSLGFKIDKTRESIALLRLYL